MSVERLQELLGEYCAGGYSSGFYGEANARWVEDNYPHIAVVSNVYRIGNMACLLRGVDDDTEGVAELVEVLEGLEDYPLIDDQYLQDLIMKDEERVVGELATEWEVPPAIVWESLEACDVTLDWEQDYVYLASCYEDEVKEKALELNQVELKAMQTWETHYFAGQNHTVEVCEYCAEAKEVA